MLQWERPPNLNKNVNVNYTVEIANLTSESVTEVCVSYEGSSVKKPLSSRLILLELKLKKIMLL